MAHQLNFEHLIRYDPGEPGVTVDVALKLSDRSISFAAKVDTGSSYCIFERKHGVGIVDYEGRLLLSQYEAP